MVEQGDVFLHIEGRLEIEKIKFLTSQLKSKLQNKKVIFCLEKLSFVGSCGIQKFFYIEDLHKKTNYKSTYRWTSTRFSIHA